MLEKAHDYFSKLFKTAYHSILKSFRAFFPLFIAILLIESILFSVFLSFQNNISLRSEKIAKEYPHHIVVSGLNEEEMLLLRNDDRTVSLNDHCFDVTKTIKYESNAYDPTYTVYIKILTGNKNYGIYKWFIDDSLEANYEAMRYRYRDVFETKDGPNERLSILVTPLYTQEADITSLPCSVHSFIKRTVQAFTHPSFPLKIGYLFSYGWRLFYIFLSCLRCVRQPKRSPCSFYPLKRTQIPCPRRSVRFLSSANVFPYRMSCFPFCDSAVTI